jgi:hypothetical protein
MKKMLLLLQPERQDVKIVNWLVVLDIRYKIPTTTTMTLMRIYLETTVLHLPPRPQEETKLLPDLRQQKQKQTVLRGKTIVQRW